MQGILISHRRDDQDITTRLIDCLKNEFQSRHIVSLAVPTYDQRAQRARSALKPGDILIIVIGKNWNPKDHRIEIDVALSLGVQIVSVLLDDVGGPQPDDLPETLRRLTEYPGIRVRSAQFQDDIQHLITEVQKVPAPDNPWSDNQDMLMPRGMPVNACVEFDRDSSPDVEETLPALADHSNPDEDEEQQLAKKRLTERWHRLRSVSAPSPLRQLISAFAKAFGSSAQTHEEKHSFSDMMTVHPTHQRDTVDCSVFAPASPRRGQQILVQAILHEAKQLARVAKMAAILDPDANRKGFIKLSTRIRRGTSVQTFLEIPALHITEPLQEMTWKGEPARIVYSVDIPTTARLGPCQGTLHVMIGGLPVGEVIFELNISDERRTGARVGFVSMDTSDDDEEAVYPVVVDAKQFKHAFISYSRKDAHQVLLYAEALDDCGIELLIDLTAIEPGAEWELELSKLIGKADVFYLMWSKNAATSQWVDKETRIAVQRYDESSRREPRIRPVLIEQPTPDPPDHLKRFHFNSKWLALRTAHGQSFLSGAANKQT